MYKDMLKYTNIDRIVLLLFKFLSITQDVIYKYIYNASKALVADDIYYRYIEELSLLKEIGIEKLEKVEEEGKKLCLN